MPAARRRTSTNGHKYRECAQNADENSKVAEIDALSNLQKHAYRKQPKGEGNDDGDERVNAVVNAPFQELQPDFCTDHGRDIEKKAEVECIGRRVPTEQQRRYRQSGSTQAGEGGKSLDDADEQRILHRHALVSAHRSPGDLLEEPGHDEQNADEDERDAARNVDLI